MISVDYARTMARYNQWQNRSLYGQADRLTDPQRREHRGSFFGSIHATLNHLLFGDQIWMFRFHAGPRPRAATIKASLDAYPDWNELKQARVAFDDVIVAWADQLDPAWLDGELAWTPPALGVVTTRPRRLLVTHMFNHQTHHRGQVHCMLTGLGMSPEDTDLPLMADGFPPTLR